MNITTKQSHPPYPFMRIFTFGEFAIERLISSPTAPTFPPRYAQLPWEEWSNRRASMELLKILLCTPNRRASKDELIQSIWPNHTMINALHALDSAASILRRHILRTHSEESLLLTVRSNGDTALKLAAQPYLWIDADTFLTLAAWAARAENQGQDPISANLRDQDPPNGSCNHGSLLICRDGCWYGKPVTHLSVKMGPIAMTATQKAL